MNLNKNQVMAMMSCPINDNFQVVASSNGELFGYSQSTSGSVTNAFYSYPPTPWEFWRDNYYPLVIRESYPIYLQEKSVDKGKQAFELLKALMDKKLLKVEKVGEFIEAMDVILKTL